MTITVKDVAETEPVTVQIKGRFDFSTHQDFTRAYKQFPKGERSFVVDLSETYYMDSSALGMLLQLREHSNKGVVTLANSSADILAILRIANFNRLFNLE